MEHVESLKIRFGIAIIQSANKKSIYIYFTFSFYDEVKKCNGTSLK